MISICAQCGGSTAALGTNRGIWYDKDQKRFAVLYATSPQEAGYPNWEFRGLIHRKCLPPVGLGGYSLTGLALPYLGVTSHHDLAEVEKKLAVEASHES